ncbi:MAG: CHAD domain-containing protein, partial [Gammaproteobacteria bacterium]|nr:CHAD domain-containing protein [Gammaproteobacteria bacterium]
MPELNWLDLGAATAARTLLLRALTDADGPAQRLAQGRDGAALHDFRVALRRLRTTERAYRSSLGESGLPKKLRRRLRRLVRDTGAARDAEVHLALLAGPREILRPHQRAGLRWFEQHLHARLRREDARLRERLRRDFPRLRNKLETHLRA